MSHDSFSAQVFIIRSIWNEATGADISAHEIVTSESTDGHGSIISLLSKVERIAGRKLAPTIDEDESHVGHDNWIEDGHIYDITISVFKSVNCDMSAYFEGV